MWLYNMFVTSFLKQLLKYWFKTNKKKLLWNYSIICWDSLIQANTTSSLHHIILSFCMYPKPQCKPFVPAPFQIFWTLTQPIWILKPLSIPSWLILGRVVTTLRAVRYTFKYVTHCKQVLFVLYLSCGDSLLS